MTTNYNSDVGSFALVKWDLVEGLKRWEVWVNLAWGEISARYGRTIIGVSWNVISFALFCLAIIFIFGDLSPGSGKRFGPHVVVGLLVYTFVSSLIIDACGVLNQNESWLKGIRLPYGIFIYKGVMRNTIILSFNLGAALTILLMFYDLKFYANQWLLLPAFLIMLLNAIAAYMLLGTLCARFRDLTHLIITLMRFSLFITPIMWTPGESGIRGIIAIYNPLTHFIEIVRKPVLYGTSAGFSWIVVLSITAVMWIMAIAVFARYRKQIIYWL